MNKAKKQSHKQGTTKRLVRGSLVLSCTRALSTKLLRFFEKGAASRFIVPIRNIDNFVRQKVTSPLTQKIGLRKNFSVPVRNSIAGFFSRNSIFKKIDWLRTELLCSSLRSVGVFLLTFGIYGMIAFLLKRFLQSPLGAANPDDFSFAAITSVAGILLSLFGDKSIISSLGTARITGNLLSNHLGINSSSFDRYYSQATRKSTAIGFFVGSLLGVSTIFFSPATALFCLLLLIIAVTVFHIPEFGLLLAVSTFSFLPIDCSAIITSLTFVSFFVKYVRLKRNFRFGTADSVVLVMFFSLLVFFSLSGGDISKSEAYLLCFVLIYFLAKNLLCSQTLVYQTFNALCTGLSFGMALYILSEYAVYIPHEHLRATALALTENTLDADMLFMLISATLPFAFSSFSLPINKRPKTWFVIIAIACAVITDSFLCYALILVALFIFIAFASKSPVGSLFAAVITLPTLFVIISDFTSSIEVVPAFAKPLDEVFLAQSRFVNLWSALLSVGGVVVLLLFFVALVFILQRIFACTVLNKTARNVLASGTLVSSALMLIGCSLIFNPLSDLRAFALMWFIFGFCGAVYKVCYSSQTDYSEE